MPPASTLSNLPALCPFHSLNPSRYVPLTHSLSYYVPLTLSCCVSLLIVVPPSRTPNVPTAPSLSRLCLPLTLALALILSLPHSALPPVSVSLPLHHYISLPLRLELNSVTQRSTSISMQSTQRQHRMCNGTEGAARAGLDTGTSEKERIGRSDNQQGISSVPRRVTSLLQCVSSRVKVPPPAGRPWPQICGGRSDQPTG